MLSLCHVPAISFGLLCLGETRCHVMQTLKQPNEDVHVVESMRPPANNYVSELLWMSGGWLEFNPVKPSDDCSPCQHLDYNLMRGPELK